MDKLTLDKIRAEYREMEENRNTFNSAYKKIAQHFLIENADKKNLNEAYQAILKNMAAIAESFEKDMKE